MRLSKTFNIYIILCYLFLFQALDGYAQDEQRTLQIGADYAYYPYEYVNEFNQADGFDIDIMKALTSELNMDYEIQSDNWFSIKQKIEKGELDMLAGMYFHPDRANKVNFSMPYIIITHSIFVNKGDYLHSLKDVRDQENLKVVVENSSILHKYLTTAGISSERILPVENQLDALRILSESKNTCALLPELQGKYIAAKNGYDDVTTVGLPILPREYSIAVNKADTLLLNQINDAITEIHNNGIYESIYNKWFGKYEQLDQETFGFTSTEIILFLLFVVLSFLFVLQYFRWMKYKQRKEEQLAKEELENQKIKVKLLKNETLFRQITENSPYSIAIIDHDAQFSYVNRKFEDEFGYTKKEISDLESWVHLSILDIKQQENIKSVFYQFINTQAKNPDIKNVHIESVHVIDKSGQAKNIILRLASLGENQTIVFFEDNTENQKKYHQLKAAKAKAESADKQKTSFLANISHEIRTPMNSILGFSSLLAEDEITKEEKSEYSHLIRKNGNVLLLLIQDIIDISKIEAGILTIEPKLEKLSSIIDDAYNTIKKDYGMKIPEPIQLSLELLEHMEHKHYFIRVDRYRMSQVLNNILTNAFKFTDKGSVKFGIKELPNRKIRVYVTDTGIGIKEKDIEFIFNRFNRVDSKDVRSRRGTGLGLAISYQILKLFGSELIIESTFNEGSTFYFDLPYYEGQGDTIDDKVPEFTSSTSVNYDWNAKTILVVEDNKENANYIESALRKTNCKLIICEDGEQALKAIQSDQKIDLLLLDWLLPDMKGNKIVDYIKMNHMKFPIIVVTALALIEDQLEIKEHQIDEYMAKPVDKNYLLHRINQFLYQ